MKRHLHSVKTLDRLLVLVSLILLIASPSLTAQEAQKTASEPPEKPGIKESSKELSEDALSVTRHSVEINDKNLNYTAMAGYLPGG